MDEAAPTLASASQGREPAPLHPGAERGREWSVPRRATIASSRARSSCWARSSSGPSRRSQESEDRRLHTAAVAIVEEIDAVVGSGEHQGAHTWDGPIPGPSVL